MKKYFLPLLFILITLKGYSQSEIIKLWDVIPNHVKTNEVEIYPERSILWIELVQVPTLEVFLPVKNFATGQAVVICPGGGYKGLSYDWEGTEIAKWYNTKGIAAFVLKSRLPGSKSIKVAHEAPLQDAQRAMRIVRKNAEKWNINPDKIGIMGFSAGGHLACTLGTQFDSPNNFKETDLDTISAKPNFMVLLYPVVTMKDDFTHKGSQRNLLGENPSVALKEKYSNELHVTAKTPPTFLLHSGDDKAVPVENTLQFYAALRKNNIPAEMHIYPIGGHGYSLALGKGNLQKWTDQLYEWLLLLP